MLQFDVHLTSFLCPLWEISLSQVFRRVFKKYMMCRLWTTFDPIFGIYGIFYDQWDPLQGVKVPLNS